MPERTEYEPGTPSWVDLGTPDVAGSTAFYTALFGWEASAAPEPEAGGYIMFTKDGHAVAGMGPLLSNEQPSVWSTYITVVDADATTAAAKAAGGQIFLAPMDVLDTGRMAILFDPNGAAVSIWQPRTHIGAGLVNEPGSLCWNELTTRHPQDAIDFYTTVFGWHAHVNSFPLPDGGEGSYTEWRLEADGDPIGGMMVMGDDWPADLPPHWMTYFAVEDTDAAAARAAELGGAVPVAPTDIPPGRMAVLNDPSGASFTVLKLNG